jgi:ABC-type spermidine/putrescine transport system permease subunit II
VRRGRLGQGLTWVYVTGVLALLYVPILPPLLTSVSPTGRNPSLTGLTLEWYGTLGQNPMLTGSIATSIEVALMTGLITPVLALLAAMAVRELRVPRLVLMLMILPLFIPGVSMGLSTAFFFSQLGLPPSMLSVTLVNILWALPFAFLIVLTAMAGFDPVYMEAAYVHGANRWRAFIDVELPLIRPGVMGSAVFSVILSFNETVRTTLVQGPLNTVQTYIWSQFLQVGLSPQIYVLMSIMIGLTLILVFGLLVFATRR